MDNQNCYIEFDFQVDEYFDDLFLVFEHIKTIRNNNQPQEDVFWLKSFPDYSLKHFYFLLTDLRPDFETAQEGEFTWHFYSLIELLQADYDIEYKSCSKVDTNKGRLEYYPWGYPYGGITGLITFVKSFNCTPTIIDDGTGIYKIYHLENGDFSMKDITNGHSV